MYSSIYAHYIFRLCKYTYLSMHPCVNLSVHNVYNAYKAKTLSIYQSACLQFFGLMDFDGGCCMD